MGWDHVALGAVVLWAAFGVWMVYRGLTAVDEPGQGVYDQEDYQ